MTPAKRTRFRDLITLLTGAGVEFIIVGGVAGEAHGPARQALSPWRAPEPAVAELEIIREERDRRR